jgi:hypothetical protein
MNDHLARTLLILAGLLLAALWIAGASLVITLSLMGTLMANDAGTAPAEAQTSMVLLVLGGQLLAGAAGVPLGLAVFWRTRRKLLLRIFAGLFGIGLTLVIVGVYVFASGLPG